MKNSQTSHLLARSRRRARSSIQQVAASQLTTNHQRGGDEQNRRKNLKRKVEEWLDEEDVGVKEKVE